jgi:hypothetical protein
MEEVTTIGLDIAKHGFHAHGAERTSPLMLQPFASRAGIGGLYRPSTGILGQVRSSCGPTANAETSRRPRNATQTRSATPEHLDRHGLLLLPESAETPV